MLYIPFMGLICTPCLTASIMVDSSASYIRMVQHLIEKCLQFNMNKEECVETLSKHANLNPIITSTVWNELEKENKEFFEEYIRARERLAGTESLQGIQAESSTTSD